MTLPQSLHLRAANPSHQHQAPATIPSRRTEPPDARLAFALRKNRHAIARRAPASGLQLVRISLIRVGRLSVEPD